MFGKKSNTPKVKEAVHQAVDYEVALADVVRRSERRAWFVATAAIIMALLLAGGYYVMLPLKERTPFLVMADAYTGTATVAKLRGDFGKNSITANEAVNRSNLAHYVIARESYDLTQRDIRDWLVIFTMSTPEISGAYRYLYSQNNPNSLPATYGKLKAIRIKIISITLLDSRRDTKGPGTGGGDAAVRFQRILVDKSSGGTSILDTQIANIRYNYSKELALDEEQRMENPLGFQVTSYRVDRELVSSPVMPDGELPMPAGTATAPALPPAQGQIPAGSVPATQPPAGQPQAAPPAAAPGQVPIQTPADPRATPAPAQPASTNGVANP